MNEVSCSTPKYKAITQCSFTAEPPSVSSNCSDTTDVIVECCKYHLTVQCCLYIIYNYIYIYIYIHNIYIHCTTIVYVLCIRSLFLLTVTCGYRLNQDLGLSL